MTKIDKLVEKLLRNQGDFTWNELVKVLKHYGFNEIKSKGKTAVQEENLLMNIKKL